MSLDAPGVQEAHLYSRFTQRESPLPPMLGQLDERKINRIRTEITSKAKRGVIMIDLDRNLLNNEYQIENEKELKEHIAKLQTKGYLVCLNSSRSARVLRQWQQRVDTHCPTFAENGYVVDFYDPRDPQTTDFQVVNDEKAIIFNDELRTRMKGEEFLDLLHKKGFDGVDVVLCKDEEPENFMQNFSQEEKEHPSKFIIPINGWNAAKIVAFAKERKGSELRSNEAFQNAVESTLKEIASRIPFGGRKPEHKMYPDKLPDDGSILCYATPLNKTQIWTIMTAYLKLSGIDILSPDYHLFHMGDGNEDNIYYKRVTVYSPANAKPQIIERKQRLPDKTFIGTKKYTNGLLEGLSDIYEKTCTDKT